MKDIFRDFEERLLSKEVRSSRDKLSELIDDNFLEYGASWKKYDKSFILDRLPKTDFSIIDIKEFNVYQISDTCAQTRFHTKEEDGRECLRNSIWKKQGNSWKIIFHQGTLINIHN